MVDFLSFLTTTRFTIPHFDIGLDKDGYQVNSFLIPRQKRMLLVLIKIALLRHF